MISEERGSGRRTAVVVGITAPIWIIGWLFTIGFANLAFWNGALALIIWPYFLGLALR